MSGLQYKIRDYLLIDDIYSHKNGRIGSRRVGREPEGNGEGPHQRHWRSECAETRNHKCKRDSSAKVVNLCTGSGFCGEAKKTTYPSEFVIPLPQ